MTRVIVVGAGIIGASVAWHLARRGAKVQVIEAATPAQSASGRSFGWINASFFLTPDHFRLRAMGIDAWQRLDRDLGDLGLTWPGCLWWEEAGPGLTRVASELTALGYPCYPIGRTEVARREPALADPPAEALLLPSEGVVDLPTATHRLLAAAAGHGATLLSGVAVERLTGNGQTITGVETRFGLIEADMVVLATGATTPTLLAGQGVPLPKLPRPGLILRTSPLPGRINHILATPGQELRQLTDGTILAPASPNHQADSSDRLAETPENLAEATLTRLRKLLHAPELRITQMVHAERPVPGDALPVIGPARVPGLYLTDMHSGATLGAIAGVLAAEEILTGRADPILAPFRPARFA